MITNFSNLSNNELDLLFNSINLIISCKLKFSYNSNVEKILGVINNFDFPNRNEKLLISNSIAESLLVSANTSINFFIEFNFNESAEDNSSSNFNLL